MSCSLKIPMHGLMMAWELEWRLSMLRTMRRLVRLLALSLNHMVTILIVPLDMLPSIKANLPLKLLISLTILKSHQLLMVLPKLMVSLLITPLLTMHLLLKSLTGLLSPM
jgi:hypothetical protein